MERWLYYWISILLFASSSLQLAPSLQNATFLISTSKELNTIQITEEIATSSAHMFVEESHVRPILTMQPKGASIGLVGHKSQISISCDLCQDMVIKVRARSKRIIRLINRDIFLAKERNQSKSLNTNVEESLNHKANNVYYVYFIGIKPGREVLDIKLIWARNGSKVESNNNVLEEYEIWVVEPVNVLTDALIYVLLSSQVLTLLMLAFRMRGMAVKDVISKPCALFAALSCQAIFMPMVSVGVSVALSLPVHAVVCLLILGCCPTGMLAPILAVLQQAHVELALVLSFLESTMAFGVMPLWLFTYSNFLGLEYDHVAGPYYYLAGALGVIAGPLVMGLLIQRCAPRALPGIDRAIPPTCALMLLVQITVCSISFANCWEILTWRLLAAGALLPLAGNFLGILTTAIFRQRLPQIKTVAIVTGLQNTVLAKVIIQMSYPQPDAGVMVVMLTCIDFATLVLMLLAYLPHCCLWFCWTPYRPLHDHPGIGGLDHSISQRIVKSMIKAGEITFGKLQSSPRLNNLVHAFDYPTMKSTRNLASLGSLAGKQFFTSSFNKLSRNPFFLRGKTAPSTMTSSFSLHYFNNNNSNKYPNLTDSPSHSQRSEPDSLKSIDYEMLGFQKADEHGTCQPSGILGVSPSSSFNGEICRPYLCSRMSALSNHSSFTRPIISDSERDSGFCGHPSPFPERSSRPFSVLEFTDKARGGIERWGGEMYIGEYPHPPHSPTIDTQDTTVADLSSIDEEDSYTTSLDRLNKLRRSKRNGRDEFNLLSY